MKLFIMYTLTLLMLSAIAAYGINFAFTGNQHSDGVSITGVPLVACEYTAMGYSNIWHDFDATSGCPYSIDVR